MRFPGAGRRKHEHCRAEGGSGREYRGVRCARKGAIKGELAEHLVEMMGPTFRPLAIRPVKELPKTESGKVVRRLIRQQYLGEPLGDTSTVENPVALEAFRRDA